MQPRTWITNRTNTHIYKLNTREKCWMNKKKQISESARACISNAGSGTLSKRTATLLRAWVNARQENAKHCKHWTECCWFFVVVDTNKIHNKVMFWRRAHVFCIFFFLLFFLLRFLYPFIHHLLLFLATLILHKNRLIPVSTVCFVYTFVICLRSFCLVHIVFISSTHAYLSVTIVMTTMMLFLFVQTTI